MSAPLLRRYGTDADIVSGISSCQFHPDGLFFGTGTTDGVVHIWDIQDQQKKAVFEGHKGKINSLCFSENGYHLVRFTVSVRGLRHGSLPGGSTSTTRARYTAAP